MSFEAKYRGHCDECDNPIEIGDYAFYDQKGELVHVECPTPPKEAPVCRMCYLTKPCGCDDE